MQISLKTNKQDKILCRENYELFALFIISALFVYFTPGIIQNVYFLIVLYLYFRSKQNYFWIAFAFILLSTPAGFFSGSLSEDTQRLPMYSIGAGFSFSFFDLFFMISLIKAISIKKINSYYYFSSSLKLVVIFAIVLFIYSLMLGMSSPVIIFFGRTVLMPFLFFLVAPFLIKNSDEFINLLKLLLPFIFLSLIGQIYSFSYGRYLIAIVKQGESTIASTGAALAEGSDLTSRVFDSPWLNTVSMIFCGFFLIRDDKNFKPTYLILLLFINLIICFTSATRGIFLTYIAILATLVWFVYRSSFYTTRYIKYMFIGLIIGSFGLSGLQTSETITHQIQRSSDRYGTLKSISRGDVSSVDTRTEIRIPKLMQKFKESPIIGWGFSDEGLSSSDGHVGMHNMLREGGIIEMIVFVLFFFQIVSIPHQLMKRRGLTFRHRNALKYLSIAFLTMLVIHTTSSQIFGYVLGFLSIEKWFMMSLIFVGINAFYWEAKNNIQHSK